MPHSLTRLVFKMLYSLVIIVVMIYYLFSYCLVVVSENMFVTNILLNNILSTKLTLVLIVCFSTAEVNNQAL